MKYTANPIAVEAFKIVGVADKVNPDGNLHICTEEGTNRIATKEMLARYTPKPGDYWVIQSDGYEYLNPAEVFERKYAVERPAPVKFHLTLSLGHNSGYGGKHVEVEMPGDVFEGTLNDLMDLYIKPATVQIRNHIKDKR